MTKEFDDLFPMLTGDIKWLDISSEKTRFYTFPCGGELTVRGPIALHVKRHNDDPRLDSHRLVISDGEGGYRGVYVCAGWISVEWSVKDGADQVVKF